MIALLVIEIIRSRKKKRVEVQQPQVVARRCGCCSSSTSKQEKQDANFQEKQSTQDREHKQEQEQDVGSGGCCQRKSRGNDLSDDDESDAQTPVDADGVKLQVNRPNPIALCTIYTH